MLSKPRFGRSFEMMNNNNENSDLINHTTNNNNNDSNENNEQKLKLENEMRNPDEQAEMSSRDRLRQLLSALSFKKQINQTVDRKDLNDLINYIFKLL
jgi:hypothetical protein